MASQLTWLDFSESDQRRARELIQLFSQPESRDELGIGTVRDALSDLMFPGISVIQTRARYFLFIPWLFSLAADAGKRGRVLLDWVDSKQRSQIEALREGGDLEGLIGRVARQELVILPSTIYWNALQQFKILLVSGSQDQVASMGNGWQDRDSGITELSDQSPGIWQGGLPAPPDNFAHAKSLNFDLTFEEAQWLSERFQSSRGTALAYLASRSQDLVADSAGPWDEPLLRQASTPSSIRDTVRHAEFFSLVMQGSALLYNLLLAKRCGELGLERLAAQRSHFEEALDVWAAEVAERRRELQLWNLDDFWTMVSEHQGGITRRTQLFLKTWIEFATRGRVHEVRADPIWGIFITEREKAHKSPGKARLQNERLLRQWGGSSGAGRLIYRWDRVRVMLKDIAKGLSHARAQ